MDPCKYSFEERLVYAAVAGLLVKQFGFDTKLTWIAPKILTSNVHMALAGVLVESYCNPEKFNFKAGDMLNVATSTAMMAAAGYAGGHFIQPAVKGFLPKL